MQQFLLIISLFLLINASPRYYYWDTVRVVDGDTIEVIIPNIPSELKTYVRVAGVDTPEKGKKALCSKENKLASEATKLTKKMIDEAKVIKYSDIKWDKYGGRILANVTIDNKDLSVILIENKLARNYHGEKKQSWCN